VAATYVLYLGWFDGNPATLHELPPVEASEKYVEFMGGADAVLEKAQAAFDAGDYRWVAQVVNHVVFADPDNQPAKDLQAEALEQMGYQAESGPWRNFYLSGAKELRDGVVEAGTPSTASPDTIRAMTPELFFDYLGVRLNAERAGEATARLNFDFTDTGDKIFVELENGVLNHTAGMQAEDADVTLTLTREALNGIILQETTLDDAVSSGDVQVTGDEAKLGEVVSYLDTFPFWFNIVTP
jgi:alkyl sulfatase BDS1-like metallo-beta-lactamase superfamily hydrolase